LNLEAILILSGIIFTIGLYGSLTKRNAIVVVMCLELMFNAVAIAVIGFSRFRPPQVLVDTDVLSPLNVLSGHMMAVFVIAIGAAEVALALALIISIYKVKGNIELTGLNNLKN